MGAAAVGLEDVGLPAVARMGCTVGRVGVAGAAGSIPVASATCASLGCTVKERVGT